MKELKEYQKELDTVIEIFCQEIYKLNTRVQELSDKIEENIEKTKTRKTGRVKEMGRYYIISNKHDYPIFGDIEQKTEDNDFLYEIGNYFKTKEEAEKALEKIKIYTKLKRFAEENNKHEIDWDNRNQNKYVIKYDCDDRCLYISNFYRTKNMCLVYFTSKKIAEQAIKEIGRENIEKLFD